VNIALTQCRSCGGALEAALAGTENEERCGHCGRLNWVYVFPALWAGGAAGSAGERIVLDDESACFYHPEKRAAMVCEGCGRFLCALCDVAFKGKHLCTSCIERGTARGEDAFQSEYVRYDKLTLVLAVVPLLLFYLTIFTAPIALYLRIRHRNSPLSAVPVNRWRFHVAGVLSLLQIVGWGVGIAFLIGSFTWYG
jgi:hypothetical protein